LSKDCFAIVCEFGAYEARYALAYKFNNSATF